MTESVGSLSSDHAYLAWASLNNVIAPIVWLLHVISLHVFHLECVRLLFELLSLPCSHVILCGCPTRLFKLPRVFAIPSVLPPSSPSIPAPYCVPAPFYFCTLPHLNQKACSFKGLVSGIQKINKIIFHLWNISL